MRASVRYGALGVALAATAAVWGCGGGGSGDGGGTEPPMTGTVTGLANLGGSARAGLRTHLQAVGTTTDARPVQTTNAQGRYTFTLVPPGEYRVFVELGDTLEADPGPGEDTVTVAAGMTATAATFELRLLAGSVRGVVTDTVPLPLVGRNVFLRRQGSVSERSTMTGEGGSYSFATVAVGTYIVRVATACGEPTARTDTVAVQDGAQADADTIRVTPRPSTMLLSCDVQPIFTRSCTGAGCHSGGAPQEGLDLSSESRTIGTAVGVLANQPDPRYNRIEPFRARQDSSYLVCKIEAMCPNRFFARMPEGCSGADCLSSAQIDTIKGWIAAGALNN